MPILSVSLKDPEALEKFSASLRETGFAVLTEHPISPKLIQTVYQDWEAFFRSAEKNACTFDPVLQSGYFPFKSENAKGTTQKDLKEFYHLFPNTPHPPGLGEATRELFQQLVALGSKLLEGLEKQLPADIRAHLFEPLSAMIQNSQQTLFRTIHYPPLTGAEEAGAVRAAAHEDINLITLLPAATAPGLEVRDMQGQWHAVACDPGQIVVNAGDMLQLATNGYYRSTTHRVVNPRDPAQLKASRYSIPLFVHPRPEVRLSADKTAKAYLEERLREIGLIQAKA